MTITASVPLSRVRLTDLWVVFRLSTLHFVEASNLDFVEAVEDFVEASYSGFRLRFRSPLAEIGLGLGLSFAFAHRDSAYSPTVIMRIRSP